MASLVAFNSYLLVLVAQDRIQYDDDDADADNGDGADADNDDGEPRPAGLPPAIFLPGFLFNIHALPRRKFKRQFRFTAPQILELCQLLDLPYLVKTYKGDAATAEEALCLTLYRLSFPTKLDRMQLIFSRDSSAISRLVKQTIIFLTGRWDHLLTWDENRLTRAKLHEYAGAVAARGAHQSVFAFLDGTARKISRPSFGQRAMYNGHKRFHALKYQILVAPDGIIIHLSNAARGNVHDLTIYRNSGLAGILRQHAWRPDGRRLAIYGDPAYQIGAHMLRPYHDHRLMPAHHRAFNRTMAKQRVVAEWAIGKVVRYYSALDFSPTQRVLATPLALHYKVAVLFSNLHTCYYGSQTGSRFGLDSPSAATYLSR